MYAEVLEGKWRHHQIAAHALWGKLTVVRSGVAAGGRVQTGLRSYAAYACQRSIIPKVLGGLLITMAVLAITYAAAATLVNGAASHTSARTNHAMALQRAATNYRQASAQCQRLAANGRGVCLAEAHAEEDRARAVASLAPRSHVAALRSQTEAAIDAGDRDSIVIEPACNVVARGQASLCEIQVKSNSANTPAEAGTERPLIHARATITAGESRPFVQPRANTQPGKSRALIQARADSETRHHETYFFNVAAASP